jgi:hypothetical protein
MSFDEEHLDDHHLCKQEVAERDQRIRELEAAIVKFWDYSKFVLPMPVHPAVGAIMEIGRGLASTQDREVERESDSIISIAGISHPLNRGGEHG